MIVIKTTETVLGISLLIYLLSVCYAKPSSPSYEYVITNSTSDETEPAKDVETNEIDTTNLVTDSVNGYRKQYGARMISYMNQSVEPCDDFYEYACGNWRNVQHDRQASHKRSNLLDIVYTVGDAVEKLLEKSVTDLDLNYTAELQLAQQFYQACLTADLYPMKASEDYLRVIKSIGGFPAVDETWNATSFSWFNMSAHLTNYGVGGLINEKISDDYPFGPYFELPELGFEYIVHSDNIKTNLTRGYELNERRMRGYLNAYGVTDKKTDEVINGVFQFWHEIVELVDGLEACFEEPRYKCGILSAAIDEPFADLQNYFEIAWMGKDFDLTEDDFPCDFFYVELDKICVKHKESVANYLAMKFLYQMDAGLKASRYQKDYCILHVKDSLPYILDKLYLQEYFNDEIHTEIVNIVKELRKSLRFSLENADWLDQTTRNEALLKESTIVSRIGSFKDPEHTERLIREMKNLTFSEGSYEQNNLNLSKFRTFMCRYNGYHHERLPNTTKPVDLLVGFEVNAFYYNIDNSINVMAGILHPPAYHKDWPNSLKFGTIGYIVGHELTHGFDTVGSMFDSTRKKRNWWSKKSSSVFNDRANCYVNHYNNYVIPEINRHINGKRTKDENIADGGGLREALDSYRRYMKELMKDVEEPYSLKNEQMSGLDLSPEQLFFLGFAQQWCSAYEEEHYWEEITDEHTMDKYRVLGAVTNIDDFAAVYKCPLGSNMHPKTDKCHLW